MSSSSRTIARSFSFEMLGSRAASRRPRTVKTLAAPSMTSPCLVALPPWDLGYMNLMTVFFSVFGEALALAVAFASGLAAFAFPFPMVGACGGGGRGTWRRWGRGR